MKYTQLAENTAMNKQELCLLLTLAAARVLTAADAWALRPATLFKLTPGRLAGEGRRGEDVGTRARTPAKDYRYGGQELHL